MGHGHSHHHHHHQHEDREHITIALDRQKVQVSDQMCKERCVATPGCNGVVFSADMCWLKSKMGKPSHRNGHTSILYTMTWKEQPQTTYKGGATLHEDRGITKELCKQRCEEMSSCTHVNFWSNNCKYLYGITGTEHNRNATLLSKHRSWGGYQKNTDHPGDDLQSESNSCFSQCTKPPGGIAPKWCDTFMKEYCEKHPDQKESPACVCLDTAGVKAERSRKIETLVRSGTPRVDAGVIADTAFPLTEPNCWYEKCSDPSSFKTTSMLQNVHLCNTCVSSESVTIRGRSVSLGDIHQKTVQNCKGHGRNISLQHVAVQTDSDVKGSNITMAATQKSHGSGQVPTNTEIEKRGGSG